MWFGSLFAVIVEMVPLAHRSFTISFFLFAMNMLGGVASIIVEPVAKAIGFRESLYVFYVGFYFISKFRPVEVSSFFAYVWKFYLIAT